MLCILFDSLVLAIVQHMDREFLVRMSYMEIYNEDINDLLVPEHRKLQIHESIEVNNPSFHVILITNHL
jgi:hypothetical protein